ncbi:MAG: sigma-70 family RNA polymerase sigma factor [Actinobacteria bacterium]|nr:MAG: sigma-70 family RNA polymerase sigma factor [Actinomycetota bacterium]
MPVLYGNALRLTGNTEDAADLVQVTFERAFKAFDKYQPGTNLKAWLFRIQTNAHINDYRKAQRTPRLSDADTVEDWQMARAETHTARGLRSTETEVLEGIPEQVVTEALAALSPDYRQAVLLADVEGMRYKEIAEIMGTPVGTVMSRLHRGRKLLRESLLEHARDVGYLRESEGEQP